MRRQMRRRAGDGATPKTGFFMLKRLTDKYFPKLLRVPRVRIWYENLTSPDNLFGPPPTANKLWNNFKQDIKPFLRGWLSHQWLQVRTAGVRVRVKAYKPVKPAKKFLIALADLPPSVQSAERCIESAKKCGEDHNLELVPGINKFKAQDFFARHNLTWNMQYADTTDPHAGMGCFSSHYVLWSRCAELGKPVMVLEHDAVFVAPVQALRFKHVIVLGRPYFFGYRISKMSTRKKREIFHPWRFLRGTHCYAITPEGAEILLKKASRMLLPPVDLFMNKSNVDILYYHPAPVGLDVRFTSIATRDAYILRQKREPLASGNP